MCELKFSVITPTHKRQPYLEDLFVSLRNQTHQNWEWVLYLNGGITQNDIPAYILRDVRVKVFSGAEEGSIGAIKHSAFLRGSGDVLVEVDHDDMLTENCLAELDAAFQDESVGFAYSDCAVLHMENKFIPYSSAFGWEHRTVTFQSAQLPAMRGFEPSSHALTYIWYAPDHVRAWRRSVYEELGGHNPEFQVCDDHELLIRTYLSTKMVRIPKALYVYRITGDNTWLERNADIQETTQRLCQRYARVLAEKDARDAGLMLVDLGGGINPLPGYHVIDQFEGDTLCDLNEGIPLADNSVGVLNASHVIEHLRDPIKTMREIHRVLAHGGWAFIEVPSTDGRGAFQDPTHVSFWNENSFRYYCHRDYAKYIRNTDIRFQQFFLTTEWWEDHIAVTHAWLVANKPGGRRLPHLLEI